MSTFIALAWREFVLLGLLAAVGSGFACWPRGLTPLTRIALAPAFGFAVASCALMTAALVVDQHIAAWVVLVPLALASPAFALREVRRRGQASKVTAGDALQLAAPLAVVLAALSAPLIARGSLGPVTAAVADVGGYVNVIDGLGHNAMGGDRWGAVWDLPRLFGWAYSEDLQHIGENFYPAAVNALFGWNANEMQSAATIVMIAVTALGAFGVTRELVRVRYADVLAGLLIAGPLFTTLFINGSMATLAGQAVLLPFGLFAQRALARGETRDIVVLGLFAAAVQTLFSSVVPAFVLAGAAVLALTAFLRRRELDRRVVRRVALGVGVVMVLGIVFSPVSFVRDVKLWHSLLTGDDYVTRLPYDMRLQKLPGWLFGTREFGSLKLVENATLKEALRALVIPLTLVAVTVFGLIRNQRVLVFAAIFAGGAVLAFYAETSRDCAYCAERNLAAIAPTVAVGLAAGVGALWALRWRGARFAAFAVALVALAANVHAGSIVLRRTLVASMLPSDARVVADAVKGRTGPILLEGLNTVAAEAVGESPSIYNQVHGVTREMIAIDSEHDNYGGLVYLPRGPLPARKTWTADYDWVFTRIPSIRTDRETVLRRGPFALQRRTADFDVSIERGLWVDRAIYDRDGTAYIVPLNAPLEFWIAARKPDAVWLRFTIEKAFSGEVELPRGVAAERRRPGRLDACIAVPGRADQRRVIVQFAFGNVAPRAATRQFDTSSRPGIGPALTAMSASTRPCER